MNTPFTQQDIQGLQEQMREQQRNQANVMGEMSAETSIEAMAESAEALADIGFSAMHEVSAESAGGILEAGAELFAGIFEIFG